MFATFIVIGILIPGPLGSRAHAGLPPLVRSPNTIRATGIGQPPSHITGSRATMMARRAADVIAVRNLANKLGLGRRATIRGFRYVLTEYRPDGSVRVVVEYPRTPVRRGMGRKAGP